MVGIWNQRKNWKNCKEPWSDAGDVRDWSPTFKKSRIINPEDTRIGITGHTLFPVLEIQTPGFSSSDLLLPPMVGIGPDECLPEIEAVNGYSVPFINLALPINLIPCIGMTALPSVIAILQRRFDVPRPRINLYLKR